jgi:hypothetical protein
VKSDVRRRKLPSSMVDPKKQALDIYEEICATSADRPFTFRSVEQMHREIAAWQENNSALASLRQASSEVQTAFLNQSVEWMKAELREQANFRVASTLFDAIVYALNSAAKPLPNELVLKLLTELRENHAIRFSYPFDRFLSVISPDQVTGEIRAELRRLQLHYAPTATGKIDERTQRTRNHLAELIHVEGEEALDPERGPWSRIVCEEIVAYEEITSSGWQGLLAHCRALEQAVPASKWRKRGLDLAHALGESSVWTTLQRWLKLGPTPGQPAEACSPIEDSSYQKGAVWLLALSQRPEAASTIGDFAVACLRKIPMIGAVSQKVGFACVQALGSMECPEAVSQLARLRAKVKYSVALRLIEKCLHQAAERNGMTVDELEDLAAPSYSLDGGGQTEITVGDSTATLRLSTKGHVAVIWRNADGEVVKSAPARTKAALGKEVKSVSALAKELEQGCVAQRYRLESSFVQPRVMSPVHWHRHFIDHPLLGFLGRRLIWAFANEQGWEDSGLYCDGRVCSPGGGFLDIARATKVRLWHPLSSGTSEVQQWRQSIFDLGVRQPFRQAYREFYEVTEDERQTKTYSNRFAGTLMRQHQFASLCRARGWKYRLMGSAFDGFNVPTKLLAPWNMHAEFYVDLPSDRKPLLSESALADQSDFGINLFLGSDQVRFYRDLREIEIADVPAIVYSEVMRDVDLFTSISAVGSDESWSDQGDRGTGLLSSTKNLEELSAIFALRVEMISRVLPLTAIAPQSKIEGIWLVIRGQLGTYRIQIPWGGVSRLTDAGARPINIPQKLLEGLSVDFSAFPIDLDHRTEMVLRKAHVLANDWNIDFPDLIRQLM